MKLLLILVAVTQAKESQVLQDFSIGYNKFTAEVYKEIVKSNSGNILVCPLSVQVILGLTTYGAEDKTAEQLSTGLHLPEDKQKLKHIFKELSPYLQDNGNYTLTSANKIYLKHGFDINKDFKSTAIDVFKSDIQNIDFKKTVEAAAEINKWIGKQTHDKITNVISKDDLNEDTRTVLVNAMYFHGEWITKFKEENTKKRAFHINKENETQVDMMEVTENFKYYENSELKAKFLELPYAGGEVTMTFVLPDDVEGLSLLEDRLADVINDPKYTKEKVHVVIPKFKIESTIQFKPILQALGVEDAFEDYANFKGISSVPTKIDKIIHKAYIEVEEKGTTAAAATVVAQILIRSRQPKTNPPKEFIADHPLIYYLKSSAGVIFIGRYIQA